MQTPATDRFPVRRRATAVRLLVVTAMCLSTVPALAAAQLSDAELQAVRAAERARVEVIDHVEDTVVLIYGENPAAGGGSGVVFHPDGLALTNFHVIKGAGGDSGWAGVDGEMYRWSLVGLDPGGDLAMIQLHGRDAWPFAELGDSDRVRVGDFALAMGNPFALAADRRPTVTMGIVSGLRRYQGGVQGNLLVYGDCIQVDTSINPGNSGGPLFDMTGRLIGINGRGSFEERGRVNVGIGFAISARQVRNFIPDLMATKVVRHGTLDAVFEKRGDRVLCTAVDLGRCPLIPHGFDIGDELVSFDGRPIRTANQYLNALSILPADWPVEVRWRHQGELRAATVRLNVQPYPTMNRQVRVNPERPDDDEQDGGDDGDGNEQGEGPEAPVRRIRVNTTAMPAHDAIPRPDMNRRNAERILRRWSPDAAKLAEGGPAEALLNAAATMILDRATGLGQGGDAFADLTLLGGDRVGDRRALVIRAGFPDGRRGLYRFSLFNKAGLLHHDLLAAAWLDAPDPADEGAGDAADADPAKEPTDD